MFDLVITLVRSFGHDHNTGTHNTDACTILLRSYCSMRLEDEAAQRFTDDLTILAHPIRVQILDLPRSSGDVCVCDLEPALPVKRPTVSHHLKLLREAGLIGCERRGLWAYYFVERRAVAALRQRIVAQFDTLS